MQLRYIRLYRVVQAPAERVAPLRLDNDRRPCPEGERLFEAQLWDAYRDDARRNHMGFGDGPLWGSSHLASHAVELLFCRSCRDPIAGQLVPGGKVVASSK